SCWGLQVAVTAAGGRVRRNPRGREFGVARRIELGEAGGRHGEVTGKTTGVRAKTRDPSGTGQPPGGTGGVGGERDEGAAAGGPLRSGHFLGCAVSPRIQL